MYCVNSFEFVLNNCVKSFEFWYESVVIEVAIETQVSDLQGPSCLKKGHVLFHGTVFS